IKTVKKRSGVKYAFPNYIKKVSSITNDTYSKYQWALENTGQNSGTAGADINAEGLWTKAAQADKEVVVAVIDTGIDFNHEDLKDVIWENPYGSKLVGKNGYDFTSVTSTKPQDDNGHGTHVAGIIAGIGDNEKGISGVNKTNVKIMPLKCFYSDGSGSTYAELCSYDYVARAVKLGTNVKAVNCSFGGTGDEEEKLAYEEIYNELGASGVITVVSAGNESEDLGNLDPNWFNERDYILPASCDSQYCITVAASDENDNIVSFSNYSDKYVDVAAPGNDILSSVCSPCFNPSIYTAEQVEALAKNFQNYDGEVKEGDFGYPVISDKTSEKFDMKSNATVAQSDTFFGEDGKSLAVTFNESADEDNEDTAVYMLEIPYTLDDQNTPYRISFMASTNVPNLSGIAVDVPADFKLYDTSYYTEEFDIYPNSGTWDHYEFVIDPAKTENYRKSTDRKLQIYLEAKKGYEFYIDDFAVSKQGVDEAQFGKYDFYSGTSMAAPYVTGAVALVSNCNPDARPIDVINMVTNTGRVNSSFEGKVEGNRSLSLDNTDKVPPVITSVAYSADGKNIEISGSMNNASSVTVNGESVTPASTAADKIVIPDNNYNTNKITVNLSNEYGTSSFSTFLSKEPQFPTSNKVVGAPDYTYELIPVLAGDKAYFVNMATGVVESLSYNIATDKYNYQTAGYINLPGLFESKAVMQITSATYYNNKIYFTAASAIVNSMQEILGYETVFASYDISKGKTTALCEIPNVPVNGATLAAYKGGFYIIGGFDTDERAFLDTVYKYNSSTKAFDLLDAKLPLGKAFTKYVVYGDKLVGMCGVDETGAMPAPDVFDGTSWTKSSKTFDTEEGEYLFADSNGKEYYYIEGNVGLGENGVFCNGAYVYGMGDTYTYNPADDTFTASEYSSRDKLFGVTVPGCFIGFVADKYVNYDDDDDDDFLYSLSKRASASDYYDDDDDYDDYDDEKVTKTAYLLPLKNTTNDPAKQTYITLKKSSASLYVKGTYSIKATVRNSKGKTTYTSSNSKVAKVSSSGKITALKKGTAKITVKNNGVKKTFTVTVKNPKLNATSKTLKKGKTFTIKITGKIGAAKFTSSNKKVATVSSSGKVTAKSKGKAVITVTANGVKLKLNITVK
ncbi:MAG: S8 family serine peptidase, partial [Ruminococcus sp.]|nr:S8 family serine peptidase [Ruminococcus sp.]